MSSNRGFFQVMVGIIGVLFFLSTILDQIINTLPGWMSGGMANNDVEWLPVILLILTSVFMILFGFVFPPVNGTAIAKILGGLVMTAAGGGGAWAQIRDPSAIVIISGVPFPIAIVFIAAAFAGIYLFFDGIKALR